MTVASDIRIGTRLIGPDRPMYVIAELSANHAHRLDRAVELIRIAADCGADAVKLQTYTPESMTLDSDRPEYLVGGGTLWDGRTLHDLYAEAMTPWEWHADLQQAARELDLDLFSTPFDASAVDFLDDLGTPVFKVASFELVDLELIRYAASKKRPLIMSTGMATTAEIDDAVAAAHEGGATEIALLRCNSSYPASPEEMDLVTITDMQARWQVPVGLSDHTLTPVAALVALGLGACILEKHLTLDRSDGGPDSAFSLEPAEFRELVSQLREAEASRGHVRYGPSPAETKSLAFRRSLIVVKDVLRGATITADDVRALRPAHGMAPKHLPEVIGRIAARDLQRGEPLQPDMLA